MDSSLIEKAVAEYQAGDLSIGAAAEMSGLTRAEFEQELSSRHVVRNYGPKDWSIETRPVTGKGNRALRRINGRTRHGLPLHSIRAACALRDPIQANAMLSAVRADLMGRRKWTPTLAASWDDAVRLIQSSTEQQDPAPTTPRNA